MRAILLALLATVVVATHPARADPVVPFEEHCVVNVATDDALNVRRRPRSESRVEGEWDYGTCGILVTGECRGNWCPVEDGHILGWAHRRYLAMVSPAMYCVANVARGDTLNLRAWPSAQSRVLTRLGRRQCGIAFLPYATGNWQKVRVDGWEGWVNRRFVSGQ